MRSGALIAYLADLVFDIEGEIGATANTPRVRKGTYDCNMGRRVRRGKKNCQFGRSD